MIVDVTTIFLAHMPIEANVAASHFPFAYRIRIKNVGTVPVRVLGRQWVFTDASGGSIQVPRGSPGIVGHTPLLEPWQCFEYISGVHLATRTGSLIGSFQCRVEGGDALPFDAHVDKTILNGPTHLH